jgi:hypothetical protein
MVIIRQPTTIMLSPGISPLKLLSPIACPIEESKAVPKTAHHVLS